MITNLTRALFCFLPLAASALVGCDAVDQDDFVARDGISPDPTAIIEGTIVYDGPPPRCLNGTNGQPERVLGNVVLNMYLAESAPFPEGPATGSVNLLVVLGERLFGVEDCKATGTITRSAPFVWSRLTLNPEAPTSVQIRAFYDAEENFNPLFGARRGTTAGDVLGAAVSDIGDPARPLATLVLPRTFDVPNGVVLRGTTVLLDQPVVTERPVFRLGDDRRLSADAAFVPDASPAASLRRFRALTCSDPSRGDGVSCGASFSLLARSDATKLAASGLELAQDDARAYAFYVDQVDLTTVRVDEIDVPNRADGQVDPHPVLGPTLGVDWYGPMVLFNRRRTELEVAVGIPEVRFIGSLLLSDPPPPRGTSLGAGPVPLVVPPMAFVEWPSTTAGTTCRLPYVAPRTPGAVTSGRLAHCGELPTGAYDVTLVGGSAGGLPGAAGARPSFQQWTLPNELGDPRQVFDDVIPSQGVDGLFQVVDPPAEPSRASCDAQQGTVCAGTLPLVETELGRGLDSATCVPRGCCAAIEHLCGLPLCDRVPFSEGDTSGPARIAPPQVSGAPKSEGGRNVPECVPFELPRQCCGASR